MHVYVYALYIYIYLLFKYIYIYIFVNVQIVKYQPPRWKNPVSKLYLNCPYQQDITKFHRNLVIFRTIKLSAKIH